MPYSNLVIFIMFFLNISIGLNTAYYHRGILVNERANIVKNYLSKFFYNDLITFLAFLIYLIFKESEFAKYSVFIKLLFFSNIKRFSEIHQTLDEKFKLYYRFHGVLEIFELIFFSIFIIHLFACGFYFTSFINISEYTNSWLAVAKIDTNEWLNGYMTSFYWATITIMTVGYGDITPQNSAERIFVTLAAIVGCGVFAFNVSTVGRIFENMNKDNELFK